MLKINAYIYLTFAASLVVAMGYVQKSINVMAVGVLLIWLSISIFCCCNFRQNFLLFIFQISVFTFWLSRPFIGLCQKSDWWVSADHDEKNIRFILLLMFISEAAVLCGAALAGKSYKRNDIKSGERKQKVENNILFDENLRAIAFVFFLITWFFYMIEQLEPLQAIGSGNYLDFYANFESSLPSIFHTIASFMKYSLCVYLATLPEKRNVIIVLIMYVISAIPILIIGAQNPFVLSVLFGISYFLLRDFIEKKKKWFGKKEKMMLAVCTPIGIIFMDIYRSIRSGTSMVIVNPLETIVNFFYGQGATFNKLVKGYAYRAGLRISCPVNYTFGGFIDYIYRGTLGQKIFGTEPLTSYNSIFNATNSNNLSHILSYLYLKDAYLEGHGVGSSYILENYIDFGYVGVFIFSMLLGIILIKMVTCFSGKKILRIIILVSLTQIFFIPRAEATDWLCFIITIQFWACILSCYLGAYIGTKNEIIAKILKKIGMIC